MPASPDPVLGSSFLSLAVSLGLSLVVAFVPALVDRITGRGMTTPIAVATGIGYALVCLAIWSGARVVASAPVLSAGLPSLVFLFGIGGVLLWAQATAPAWLYGRWGLLGPLVAFAVVSTGVLYAFLGVRGETDPLALYVLVSPFLVAGIVLLGMLEWTIRRLFARSDDASVARSR